MVQSSERKSLLPKILAHLIRNGNQSLILQTKESKLGKMENSEQISQKMELADMLTSTSVQFIREQSQPYYYRDLNPGFLSWYSSQFLTFEEMELFIFGA